MDTLQGKGVSGGTAIGPLCRLKQPDAPAACAGAADPQAELARWQQAARLAQQQLEELRQGALARAEQEAADLMVAHSQMLQDLDYVEAITQAITQEGQSAEQAVQAAGQRFSQLFLATEDAYMMARSADVLDISARVVRALRGWAAPVLPGTGPVVLAAADLAPSETVQLDRSRLLGILLAGGSANGHTAILARTLGIPAVIGLGPALDAVPEGCRVVLDGGSGRVLLEPDEAALAQAAQEQRERQAALARSRALPDQTADGRRVELLANIASPADLEQVRAAGAAGIGLFRSEFLFLHRAELPDEETQLAAYRAVLEGMAGKPVTIRTLDIGADKQADCLALPAQPNPALGLRGLRLCLARPELFCTQLRALYRASAFGRLSVMFPMVASPWELKKARALCAQVRQELRRQGLPFDEAMPLGTMIETPAAALLAPELAREADFFSIGTNDLAQYTLAADRQGGPELAAYYSADHPAVLRLIGLAVQAAHGANIPVGVCGELAGDPAQAERLLRLGVDRLSAAPGALPALRERLQQIDLSQPG